jgi:hypothetical protein
MAQLWGSIQTPEAQQRLLQAISGLIRQEITHLRIPIDAASQFEPSQIGTIIGTLTDALLPHIALSLGIGLTKGPGILGDREGYPDFVHTSGYRLELKGLFKDNPDVGLKKPPTRREASARLTQKVTPKNVQPDNDALLILVYQLEPTRQDPSLLSPVVVDLGIFPVIECIKARDHRLTSRGGRWFGDYETPTVLSKAGKRKLKQGETLNTSLYGRKESERHDFNEDTNFGKLKRIPLRPLHEFLAKHGAAFSPKGTYPTLWQIGSLEQSDLLPDLNDDDDDD